MKYPYHELDVNLLLNLPSTVSCGGDLILTDNLSFTNDSCQKRFQNYPIKLTYLIVIVCLSGSMSFKINLNEYVMGANDLLIVQPGDFGEFLYLSRDCKLIAIAADDEAFHYTHYPANNISLQLLFRDKPICHLHQPAIDEILTIYKMMKAKLAEIDNPYRKGALNGYLQVLLHDAYHYFEQETHATLCEQQKSTRKQQIFDQFMKTVHSDYRSHRSIAYYANTLCISPKYLSQVVLAVSGRLAGDWISDYVILEAKALLKSNKMTVQQVSDALNFSNQSFFGRYFKDKVGCSPSAYQKRL